MQMQHFYARLTAPASRDDALLVSLARLMKLDCDQIRRVSSRFTWNGW
jgi:hypothetical protein